MTISRSHQFLVVNDHFTVVTEVWKWQKEIILYKCQACNTEWKTITPIWKIPGYNNYFTSKSTTTEEADTRQSNRRGSMKWKVGTVTQHTVDRLIPMGKNILLQERNKSKEPLTYLKELLMVVKGIIAKLFLLWNRYTGTLSSEYKGNLLQGF